LQLTVSQSVRLGVEPDLGRVVRSMYTGVLEEHVCSVFRVEETSVKIVASREFLVWLILRY
jgi:hypothetical protein